MSDNNATLIAALDSAIAALTKCLDHCRSTARPEDRDQIASLYDPTMDGPIVDYVDDAGHPVCMPIRGRGIAMSDKGDRS